MQTLQTNDIRTVMRELKQSMERNQELLTQLDSAMGDGDLGITMTRAFTVADEEAQRSEETLPGKLLAKLGMAIAKAAPSTMGTLVATGFMRGGKALGEAPLLAAADLACFFEAFVKGIMERGKSAPGNKTIIDTLYPAAQALLSSEASSETMPIAMGRALVAARQGLEESTQMKAQQGRAAYYQDASIGRVDGGATVGLLLVEGFYKIISEG
jgi:phosphoenolpyruvate---glycerone phosphotransferase subunit DhaL